MPPEQAAARLEMLNKMEDPRPELLNMVPASVDQTLQLVRAVQLPKLVRQSPATDPVGHDGVRLPGHGQLSGKYFEEERPEREDVIGARCTSNGPRIGLEAVGPSLQQLGAGVDDVGVVGGVVQERELDLVLHEDVPGAEAAVDDVLGVQVA